MAKLFLLFSHQLTEAQRDDARESLGVGSGDIKYLPEDLQQRFSNAPPELASIGPWVQPLKDWLKQCAKPGDYVLIQGDFGVVVSLVAFCKEQGLRPLYATTAREVVMEGDGKKTSIFKHIRYRFY